MNFTSKDKYLTQIKSVSLLEIMQHFPVEVFFYFGSVVTDIPTYWGSKSGVIDETRKSKYIGIFAGFVQPCTDCELKTLVVTLKKILSLLSEEQPTYEKFSFLAEELHGRLKDEFQSSVFLSLTLREIAYYNDPRNGWKEIIVRFPNTVSDIEEASKCFALSRYTAAVFYSLQVVEVGLRELGKFIQVEDPKSGWTAVANKLTKIVKKTHADRTEFERKNFEFLEQVQGTVEALKNAWRNKISHGQERLVLSFTAWNQEIAEEILITSRAFMRRLAVEMPNTVPESEEK